MVMKFIERILGIITYSKMDSALNEIIAENENQRNSIRKEALESMDKLNPTKDGAAIQQLLLQMNRDLAASYERETTLRKFVDAVKR